jgi:hypothetical protein
MPEDPSIVIRRLGGGPSLIVEDASSLAHAFFSRDPSSVGLKAYDKRVGQGNPDRITTDDVRAINETMRARSPHTAWEALTSAGPLPWLAALDPTWDLVELPDRDWERFGCAALLEAAFAAAIAPRRRLAVATKMLHLKRPSLIPILDAFVSNCSEVSVARRSISCSTSVPKHSATALRCTRSERTFGRQTSPGR